MSTRLRIVISILLVGVIAGVGWRLAAAGGRTSDAVIAVSGRIEGDESAVAPKMAGRIVEIRTREGDSVGAGDVIARLDDQQIRAREEQARLAVTGAEAREQAALRQIAVFEEQLRQSALQTEQAKTDATGRVHQ